MKTEKRKQVQSLGFGLEDWIPWRWTKDSLNSSSSIPFKREGQVHSAIFKMDNQQGPTVERRELLNVMRQPGWERSLGENGYMYMNGWVPLQSTWDTINWRYSNIKQKFNVKKTMLPYKHGKIMHAPKIREESESGGRRSRTWRGFLVHWNQLVTRWSLKALLKFKPTILLSTSETIFQGS